MLIDHCQASFHRTSIEPKTNHDTSLAMPWCSHTKHYFCSEEVCFNMSCFGGRMPNAATANVITGLKVRRMPRSRSWETRGPTSCILCETSTRYALSKGGGTRGTRHGRRGPRYYYGGIDAERFLAAEYGPSNTHYVSKVYAVTMHPGASCVS